MKDRSDPWNKNKQSLLSFFMWAGNLEQMCIRDSTYDMTLENLDLEMKKLEKQGIELNIEKANRESTKVKNTKPSSDNGNEDPGLDIPEDPGEDCLLYTSSGD